MSPSSKRRLERLTLGAPWAVKQEQISAWPLNDTAHTRLPQSFTFPPHFLALRFFHFPFCSTGYGFLYFGAAQYKGEVVLTHVVLFAICTSVHLQQLRLLTNPMARLVSPTADRSMGITVNALSCFC